MAKYLIKRVLGMILVLYVTTSVVFVLARLSGDPTDMILPVDAPQEDRMALRHHLGLDQALWRQYLVFVSKAARGDFGESYFDQRPVGQIVGERLPYTAVLAGASFLLGILIAIPLGVIAAVRRGTFIDRLAQVLALGAYSMPSFWSAILLIEVFAVWLGLLPTYGAGGVNHLILPALNLTFYNTARVSRLTRSEMIDILREDYIRTARAKGLQEYSVIARHALRNALLPIITLTGLELGALLGGAVLTETVFAWPGIGWLVIRSIERRDFPVVQGIVLYVAWIFAVVNVSVDLTYAYINPRVKLS